MTQPTITVHLSACFPKDHEFRVLVNNEVCFTARYDRALGGFLFSDTFMKLSYLCGHPPLPTIAQKVNVKVETFSLPAGHCHRFSAKLDFEPKLGDVIAFGDRPSCYTIIELPHANGINPWAIVLDRPLDDPLRTNFIGFVTESIHQIAVFDPCVGVVPGISFRSKNL